MNKMNENHIKIISDLKKRIIPENYSEECLDVGISTWVFRDEVIKISGFVMLSHGWLDKLVNWIGSRRCLEVMAGTGALTYCLREKGVNIRAVDNGSWDKKFSCKWCDVEEGDAIEAVERYGKEIDVLIMSWAEMRDTAFRVLEAMRKVNPDCVMVYIGEDIGGCTADSLFFESAEFIEDDDEFNEVVRMYNTYYGIHDYPQLIK